MAEREARAAIVRLEVFSTPELRECILGHAITGGAHYAGALDSPSNFQTFGRTASVCKEWNVVVRTEANMRMLLCNYRERSTTELSKALAISPEKVKSYPYRLGAGVPRAYNFPVPETFDAILRACRRLEPGTLCPCHALPSSC